jgi:hypothetical protein
MKIKNPLHPEEITAEWITLALGSAGLINQSIVKNVKKEILGDGKGFLSSVVRLNQIPSIDLVMN